jgi:hypothetical protein
MELSAGHQAGHPTLAEAVHDAVTRAGEPVAQCPPARHWLIVPSATRSQATDERSVLSLHRLMLPETGTEWRRLSEGNHVEA